MVMGNNVLPWSLVDQYSRQGQQNPGQSNQDDFSLDTYWKLYQQSQENNRQEELAKATDDAKKAEINAYYDSELARVKQLVQSNTTDVTSLPSYYGFRSYWAQNVIPAFLNSNTHIAPSGTLYTENGSPLEPNYAQQLMANFFNTNQGQMTESEKAQLDLANRQFAYQTVSDQNKLAYQQQQDRQNQVSLDYQKALASSQSAQQQSDLYNPRTAGIDRQYSAALAANPKDWIEKWLYDHSFASQGGSSTTGVLQPLTAAKLQQQIPQMQGNVNQVWNTALETNPNVPATPGLTGNWIPQNQSTIDYIGKVQQSLDLAKNVLSWATGQGQLPVMTPEQQSQMLASGGSWSVPSYPPAPSWLPQYTGTVPQTQNSPWGNFNPGRSTNVAGQPIVKAPIVTPSGQQWNSTPWSVQQGLAGYANWVGGAPMEDIVGQMQTMLSGTPTGASYTRWTPKRQYA